MPVDLRKHYRLTDRDRDRAILELERSWFRHPGAKDTVISEKFGMTPTRYYQVLNVLLDRADALKVDPLTVRRLQRLRDQRQQKRSVGRPS